jgi:hypothetical protein
VPAIPGPKGGRSDTLPLHQRTEMPTIGEKAVQSQMPGERAVNDSSNVVATFQKRRRKLLTYGIDPLIGIVIGFTLAYLFAEPDGNWLGWLWFCLGLSIHSRSRWFGSNCLPLPGLQQGAHGLRTRWRKGCGPQSRLLSRLRGTTEIMDVPLQPPALGALRASFLAPAKHAWVRLFRKSQSQKSCGGDLS